MEERIFQKRKKLSTSILWKKKETNNPQKNSKSYLNLSNYERNPSLLESEDELDQLLEEFGIEEENTNKRERRNYVSKMLKKKTNLVDSKVISQENLQKLQDQLKPRNSFFNRKYRGKKDLPLEQRKQFGNAKYRFIIERIIFSKLLPFIGFTISLQDFEGTRIHCYYSAIELLISILIPKHLFHEKAYLFWSSYIQVYFSYLVPVYSISL